MAGLYIHIPFCTQKCIYCDFMSGTNIGLRKDYITALKTEMQSYRQFFDSDPIQTLYIGGGTPSLMSADEIRDICVAVNETWNLSNLEEFTIECNPDDLTFEYLQDIHKLQIDYCADKRDGARLSIGVQSFNDEELKWLNRRHTAEQALMSVRNAKETGYSNISIDLMFALPVQTIKTLSETLNVASKLGVQHISAYSLMFEPNSKITKLMALDKIQPLDEDLSADMYELLSARLGDAGFKQYEISNYAQEGYESLHNSGYWHGVRYLGLGPSAHSFDGEKRWANVPHTLKYIANPVDVTIENMSVDERFNELVFTALRTRIGLCLKEVAERFGEERYDTLLKEAKRFEDSGHIKIEEGRLRLTHKGIYISDTIISEFMIV